MTYPGPRLWLACSTN